MVFGRLGMEGAFFAIPTGIFASFGPAEEHRTSLIRTESTEVNLEKLSQLDELAEQVIRGQMDPGEGTASLERIVAAPARYGALLTVLSFMLASCTAARFFGGGWREMVCAGFIGLVIGCAGAATRSNEGARRVFEIVAALLASFIATMVTAYVSPLSSYVPTLAGLITLVPGLTLTTAMTEIATGNLVSGTARLTGAALTFLQIGFGVALGGQLAVAIVGSGHNEIPMHLDRWSVWVALAASPLAFVVLLRARPRDLGWILLACGAGFGGARLGLYLLGSQLGAFMGACALGVCGNVFARVAKRPAAIPLLPGMILLVPGSLGFSSLSKFIQRDVTSGVEAAFDVLLVAIALVTGLLLANVLVRPKRTL